MKKILILTTLNFGLLTLNCFSQNRNIDSLLTLLKTSKEDTNKVNILNHLSVELLNVANYEKAITAVNEAIQLSEKISFYHGNADSYSNLGHIYYYQGNYSSALENYLKSLKIEEKIGNKRRVSTILGNIGLVYNDQSDYSKALDYYERALKMFEEMGAKDGIALNLGNIGNVYNHKGNYTKALEYYFKCLKINDEQGNNREKSINLNNIGVVYCQQGHYDEALKYFLNALKIRKEIGDKRGVEVNLGNIGELYMILKKYKEAQEYFQMALKSAEEIKDLEGVTALHYSMSELYEKQNLWQLSLGYYKQYIISKDSLFNSTKSKQIAEMQTKYESEKKDKELIQKEAELLKQQVEAKQKVNERNTFIVGFLLMALFAGFIFRSLRLTRKQKNIIELQKQEVEHQKYLVDEKNKDISDSVSYAKRIQSSFLTSEAYIKRYLPEYFILYKPRDVVSGDFYWMHQQGDYLYFCVADCTGHGIPGAFMSLIGMGVLNEILFSKQIKDTNLILDELRRIVILALNPEGAQEEGKDGMDLILGRLHLQTKELQYSTANNSFYVCRNGQLIKHKLDKMPVGKYWDFEKPFRQNTIQLEAGDIIYASTDGFPDQFGGAKEQKIMSKGLEKHLSSITHNSLDKQKERLDKEFMEWKGNLEQVDDVTIIGIRI